MESSADEACRLLDASMSTASRIAKRQPMPWWNDHIADQRRKCLKARRTYTFKRRKRTEAECTLEYAVFKRKRKALTMKILAAKEDNWINLCKLVDSDPWDYPYRIVMMRLNIRRPIPGLDLPGRLETIVNNLFPSKCDYTDVVSTAIQKEFEAEEFQHSEIAAAARKLPNGKAALPDGIPNEVLKFGAKSHPDIFTTVINKCLKSSFYKSEWKTQTSYFCVN